MKINKLILFFIGFSYSLSVGAIDFNAAMQQRIELQQQAPDRHKWDFRRDAARKP